MKTATTLLYLSALFGIISATTEVSTGTGLSVEVTDGPKECEDDDKIGVGKFVSVHYTGYVLSTTEAGVNRRFDSSLDRGHPANFTVGTGVALEGNVSGLRRLCCCCVGMWPYNWNISNNYRLGERFGWIMQGRKG